MLMISDPEKYLPKEASYLGVRSKEGRVFTNEILRILPDVAANHLHTQEWIYRKRSADGFADYLKKAF